MKSCMSLFLSYQCCCQNNSDKSEMQNSTCKAHISTFANFYKYMNKTKTCFFTEG